MRGLEAGRVVGEDGSKGQGGRGAKGQRVGEVTHDSLTCTLSHPSLRA